MDDADRTRILHLEDSALDAELVREHLRREGLPCTIERAAARDAFVAALARGGFDAILADYNLPDFDGLAALHMAREVTPLTPFIFVSGALGEETAIDALKEGATDYVLKHRLQRLPLALKRALDEAQARQRRDAAERALRESERRFRTLADSAPALIWMTDENARVTFANRHYETMFGLSAASFEDDGWRRMVHPDDVDAFFAAFQGAFEARRPFQAEVRVWTREGALRWLRCEGVPRHDGAEAFLGYTGCNVDVTEARLAADVLEQRIAERTGELAAANRQLLAQIDERERVEATLRQMQRLEAVGQLTSGVAHDFNNLLTVVLGNIGFLERTTTEPMSLRRLGMMRDAAERGARLTGQLLAFSRRQKLEPKPVDLNETVANMSDLLRSSIGGTVRLETVLKPGLWPALVDATQIELVILNLAINARDAMQVGGGVTIETANVMLREGPGRPEEPGPGEYIMISVSDTGTGMSETVLAHAFEPFFTTKEVGKGSGLGLAQVYGFAKQSGGGVRIDTRLGEGTTVKVFLPRADAGRMAAARSNAGARVRACGPTTVLLLDDDNAVREVTATMLCDLGYTVLEASNGGAALEALDREPCIALLLLDFAMPGMNGAKVAREARSRRPGLPLLFITGYADADGLAGVAEGNVLRKPFREEDLAEKLRAALGDADAALPGNVVPLRRG